MANNAHLLQSIADSWEHRDVPAAHPKGALRNMLIFYAPPTIINAAYSVDVAAQTLCRYDDVVLGTGLEDPAGPYFADTRSIISKVAGWSPGTVIWGYIDTGISTGNLSLATLERQVDEWIAIGAKGIFCDVIGYAYGVSRARQNTIIDLIHSRGVGAILNVYNPDETLGSQVDATYNPQGAPTHADDRDILLLESWVCNSEAYADPFYATFSDIKTRADKARAYRQSLGVRVVASNIISHTDNTVEEVRAYHDLSEAFARVFRLDGTGLAAHTYSSSGPDAGKVQPFFSAFARTPLRTDAPYLLNGGWTAVSAPDLGITVDTDDHTWVQR